MFGYIRPEKDELKIREFELYKSVYCGLCRHLGKDYGIINRLFLSYDCTTLAMLSMATGDECPNVKDGRCVVNPMKKCRFCDSNGESFRFAGAVSVIMTYYKLQDTIEDSGFIKRLAARMLMLFLKRSYKKAKTAYPKIDEYTNTRMEQQREAEKNDLGIDRCADPTAQLISKLCGELSNGNTKQKSVLESFGYFLGRWVYIIDAADDLEKDIKHNAFNPFRANMLETIDETMLYCNDVLNMTVANLTAAYDLIELSSYKELLDNIVYNGLSLQQKYCLFEKKKKKCRKKDRDYYNYLSEGDKRN